MDFENMKRKQLQALSKEHGIPANLTNLEMANKLSSLLKVNDEKPLTRGRSCLKILDENVNDRESDVVNRKVKKVKFSPDNEIIEFTRSARVGRGGRRKAMSYKNNLKVESDGLKVGILDSPVRITRSQRVNMKDGVTEKKGRTRHVKGSVISVNESKDEVGVTTKRTLKNKEVVIMQEKREKNEGGDDGLRMSRRVRSQKNSKESIENSQEEPKIGESEKEIDRTHKRDKKMTFISGGQMDEGTKSEIKAKETKRVTRRKSMAHNQKLPVQIEVDAEVREEVAEKPAWVTRSRNLKPVEDNVSNKRNRARGKEAIQTNEELLCTEFIESSVEAVKDEVRANTRSQKNSVLEAPEKAFKRSGRVANKEKGASLSDDVTKENMVTRGKARNQTNLTVEASTSVSVESKGKHELVIQQVPLRRSDRRKSVCPLEKLRGGEAVVKKENRIFLNANEDVPRQKGIEEEPQKALKRSKRLATQVEDSVLAKGDIAENKIDRPTESQGTLEEVPQTREVPFRSNRRKSVVPSLEKVRSDEVVVVKEKRSLNANDDEIRSKGTKEESRRASKRSKKLAKQVDDPVLANRDIAENKLEERRCSRRNVANANVDTKILNSSVQEETSVVKEERRRSGRSVARHTVAAVSDDTKEKGENKLTKRNCTAIQEKDSIKLTLQDLDSPKQSTSHSKASVKAAVAKKTSTSGKKQWGRLKRSNVEVEVPMPEDTEIVREPENKDCNISGSGGTISFSRSSLNDLEAVPDDVSIVLPGTKDDVAAESSTLADKLIEEGPLVDANSSPSEDNASLKSLPFSDPFNSDARPEETYVEELLRSDHKEPASKGVCASSALADDAVPNDIASDKQEAGAIAADDAKEFVTGLSNDVLDNCSLSQSDNMAENLDSGTKDDAAIESSTLADKLIEEGPLVEANASPSENNSTSDPFSDSFNSNARPKENLDEELLQFDPEAPAGKDLCPSPVFDQNAVPNEITSDKQERSSIAADSAEGISDKALDDCSPSQSDNMEENPDSSFKERSEAGYVVTEGVIHGEQESASKIQCPSSSLADDAVPNDITSNKQEHGAAVSDYEDADTDLSNEVLGNMEENLDAGLKQQSDSGCDVKEGVTYGEQEPESKGLCPSSVLAEDAVQNDITSDKLEHGAIAADNAEELDSASSNEVIDNYSVNHFDDMEEKLDSGFKEQSESRSIDSIAVNYVEQELTITDYAKVYDAGLSNNVLLDNVDAFDQSNEMEVKFSEAEDESGHTEQAEAECDPVEAKYDPDAPIFTSQGEKHAEECANLEAGASEKTVSSPRIAVLNLQKPDILGDGITLHVTPSEDSDEDKQGEELKSLFATPCYVSHSKEEKKASLDGDSRDEDLNREGQVSPISGYDTSDFQCSVHDGGEHGQGEYLKNLFATPFGSRSNKVEIATGSAINETSSQYKHSCHENENTGEDLKGLFAMPSVVSQSVRDQHYLFQSQLSGEAMTKREGIDSSRKENSSESVRGLIENKQVEHVGTLFASPVSVKCTNQETTSSKGKYSQSHEMKTYCSGVERNLGESDAGSVGVDQAPETSHVTAFKYGDDNEHENQLKMLFASPITTQSPYQMDGTSRKSEDKNWFLSGSVRGLSHNKVFPVAHPNAMDLEEPESIDSRHSREQIKFEKIKETAESMKESSALEEENNDGLGNMLSAMSAKNMTPLQNDEFSSQETKTADVAMSGEMVRDTEMTTRHESCVQENVDIEEHKIEETVADRDLLLFTSQEPKTADVAMSGEMVRDTEMHTCHESCVQEICDTEEHKIEVTVGDRDLLLRGDISRGLEKDVYVGIANERSSPVISGPTCDNIGYSEQQMVPEINKSSIKNVKTSDAFNDGTEDHLKLLFATPIKATSPSKLGEASSCQLKTATIVMASEMAGKQPKQGFEFSGEPLTVEIISGGSNRTTKSCFSKEIEQFEAGPLFPTPSKGSPLQSEESPGCEEDILNYLDGVKFPNNREQKFAQQGDREPQNEMLDDAGEATLDWFQTNDGNVPTQMELETQNENNCAHLFELLHEERKVTEDDALAEGIEDDHLVAHQESLEDGLINTYGAAKGGDVSDVVCQQPNNPLTDIETENTTQESTRKSEGISVSAEHNEVENVSSTEELTASPNECQHVFKEDDLAAEGDRLVIIESNESTSRNVGDSGLTTQMELPGIFAGGSSNKTHSASSEEPQSGSDLGKFSEAKQQDEESFDKKEHESIEAVLSPSSKSRENISIIKEGIAGEGALMFEKKDDLAEKKVPLTPAASVAKTSFAKHLNSTVKKNNARSILIHGTPNKLTQIADMKENAPSVKGDIGTLTALRPEKRPALKDLSQK